MIETNGVQGGLSRVEAGELSRQIAGLTRAGMPLAAGLAALSEELPRGRLRQSMTELVGSLEQGVPLEQAIGAQSDRIPPHMRGLIVAGIRTGQLGDVLVRFSEYTGLGADLKRRLIVSIVYPLLLLTFALALFIFVTTYVEGQFELIFKDFGIPLPELTIFFLLIGRVVGRIAVPVGVAILCLIGTWFLARVFLKRSTRRSLATRVPLFGWIWAPARLAEFCRLLALLLESRLPLPEALRLTGKGIEDSGIERSCEVMAHEVESGRSIAQAMTKRRSFPPGLPRLLGWAESQMTLPEVLNLAGVLFETQARSQTTLVGTIVTVMCVVLVLSLVLVIPAMFLPLFTLISRLSG
jgi:type II secretory pathway component PulF